VYLKEANVVFRQLFGGVDVQIGRLPYTSGAERPSGVPKLEAVKRQRIDARLVGEFEWSIYQRAFDGVRVDWTSPRVKVTGSALMPTQGGYEDAAGLMMPDVRVYSGVATVAPGAIIPGGEIQLFAHQYDDSRRVTARPDLTGRPVARADLAITTVGGHAVAARKTDNGEADVLVWSAGQFGSWYEQKHRAYGLVGEAGYQWSRVPWWPWVRGGFTLLSGDGAPTDGTHGTFFPMLPTVRRYAQSTLYSLANLRDLALQVMLRPRAGVSTRVDLHIVGLANSADGWYAGSGATQNAGRLFGYTLRPTGGETGLMNVLEGSIDWRIDSRWSINGYAAVASRGPAVRRSFAGGPAVYGYVENVVSF